MKSQRSIILKAIEEELSVMEDMLRKLKLIVDPDAVWIVEDDGEV